MRLHATSSRASTKNDPVCRGRFRLALNDRLRGPRRGDGICVAVHDLPGPLLRAKDARGPKRTSTSISSRRDRSIFAVRTRPPQHKQDEGNEDVRACLIAGSSDALEAGVQTASADETAYGAIPQLSP